MLHKRNIQRVTVLGSGVMGSRIACLFAGIGVQVLLLDIPSPDSKIKSCPTKHIKRIGLK
jgi:3-hydroxyacyl-CoA dehydrogenase